MNMDLYDEDDDSEEERQWRRWTTEFVWQGNKYTLQVSVQDDSGFVEYHNVTATCKEAASNELIGRFQGDLLRRPCRTFFEQADAISQELQELSCTFCESNGVASRIQHEKLDQEAIEGGGLLHFDEIEVKPSHKGQDLGLRMVHEVLVQLGDRWTLAVCKFGSLGETWLKWKENCRVPWLESLHGDLSGEQQDELGRNRISVTRHFCRMGFSQAGTTPGLTKAFFLTKATYFGDDPPSSALSRWLTKEQASRIEIATEPKERNPSGLDKELADFVKSLQIVSDSPDPFDPMSNGAEAVIRQLLMTQVTSRKPSPVDRARRVGQEVARIEDLVRRGASIDESRAMHFAAALKVPASEENYILKTLVRLGGSLGHKDFHGSTPLHVAAGCQRASTVEYLLSVGADASMTDGSGKTPLQTLESSLRGMSDFAAAMGMSNMTPRPVDVVPKFETVKALMPPAQKAALVDGWMSPRMREALLLTATVKRDTMRAYEFDVEIAFTSEQYMPPDIASGQPHRTRLIMGWFYLWEAMVRILQDGRAPTIRRIRDLMESRTLSGSVDEYDDGKYLTFLELGGRYEFVVDALLGDTAAAVNDGYDDDWNYEEHKDEIEVHPPNPLDKAFDVAFVQCIHEGGGELQRRGPYRR